MTPRPSVVVAASLVLAACGSGPDAPVTRPAALSEVQARAADQCKCDTRESAGAFGEWAETTKNREALDWVASACEFKKTDSARDAEICAAVETNQKRVPLKGFVGGTLG